MLNLCDIILEIFKYRISQIMEPAQSTLMKWAKENGVGVNP